MISTLTHFASGISEWQCINKKKFTMIMLLSVLIQDISCGAFGPQHILDQPLNHPGIPTVHDSAVQARRILNLSSIATFSTIYPSAHDGHGHDWQHRPDGIEGTAVGLMEYYAICDPSPEDPVILAISISSTIQNAWAGSNATLSIRYHPPSGHPPSDDIYTYSPANLPRFSLIGHIERIPEREVKDYGIKSCFLQTHPDAAAWQPGNAIHESWWGKLVVERIYWMGGFGDRAYIGWIPKEVYRAVTQAEVEQARLVGEEGWTRKEMNEL